TFKHRKERGQRQGNPPCRCAGQRRWPREAQGGLAAPLDDDVVPLDEDDGWDVPVEYSSRAVFEPLGISVAPDVVALVALSGVVASASLGVPGVGLDCAVEAFVCDWPLAASDAGGLDAATPASPLAYSSWAVSEPLGAEPGGFSLAAALALARA